MFDNNCKKRINKIQRRGKQIRYLIFLGLIVKNKILWFNDCSIKIVLYNCNLDLLSSNEGSRLQMRFQARSQPHKRIFIALSLVYASYY